MGAYIYTAPLIEPVTLTEALNHLRVNTTEDNAMVAAQITAARMWAESYTRRAFINQTWDLKLDYDWPSRIYLPVAPLSSVTSITYLDTAGASQTLASSQYLVRETGSEGIPYIVPAYDVEWPSVYYVPETITVRFVAGYGATAATVPDPIKQAILLHVELLYDRNPVNRELLESARNTMLDPYRLLRV